MKILERRLLKSWQFFGIGQRSVLRYKLIKMYRINSRFARTRNIPRDAFVHFVRKKKGLSFALSIGNMVIIALKLVS